VEVRLADATEAERVVGALSGAGDEPATAEEDLVRVPAGDGTATLAEVVRRLDAEGVRARNLQLREPSLDDVFLALTGHAAGSESEDEVAEPAPVDAGAAR
jgi:ABC-2 type transport system ATP-binding protein